MEKSGTMHEEKVLTLVRELVSVLGSQNEGEGQGQGLCGSSQTSGIKEDFVKEATLSAQGIVDAQAETKLWHILADQEIKPAKVASVFSRALSSDVLTRKVRLDLAKLYSSLLAMSGAPALGLFDEIAWSCTIASVRTLFAKDRTSVCILSNLCKAISGRLNLNPFESSVTMTIETLAPLSREIKCIDEESDEITIEISDIWRESLDMLYRFLEFMVKPSQGCRKSATVTLMRSIQPVLLLNVSNRKAPTKVKVWLRKRALDFLKIFAK